MVFISTTKNFLGKWTGAFGTSTTVSPEYWTMTDDMNEAFSQYGKIQKILVIGEKEEKGYYFLSTLNVLFSCLKDNNFLQYP